MDIKKILACCVILALISCKKQLINKVEYTDPSLPYAISVEGGVNSLDSNQFVRLFKPAFKISDRVAPINNAQVFINDVELKTINASGVYSTRQLDNKRYNECYKLKIIYNGKTYLAEDTLKKVNPINPLELDVLKQEAKDKQYLSIPKHIFNTSVSSNFFYQMPGEQAWSPENFDTSKNYIFLHSSAPPYGLSPALEKRSNYLFSEKDSIVVYKFSISVAYRKFLYQSFQETDWKSLFSSTPGQVYGNVSGNALGFFNCSDGISKKFSVLELIK